MPSHPQVLYVTSYRAHAHLLSFVCAEIYSNKNSALILGAPVYLIYRTLFSCDTPQRALFSLFKQTYAKNQALYCTPERKQTTSFFVGLSCIALLGVVAGLTVYQLRDSNRIAEAAGEIALEAENGIVIGPATVIDDSLASGGRAVKFGTGAASVQKNYCVVQQYQGNTTGNYQALLDDLQALGVTYFRISPDWSTIEADGPGGTNELTRYDAIVNYATGKGIKIIFVIAYTPAWANGCTGGWAQACPARPPSDLGVNGSANYNNFTRRMVERYKDRIKVWEIWNEPNAGYFWQEPGKTGQQVATSYTNLAKGAYDTVKSVDPTATVLVGSVVGANSTGSTLSPLDFFNAMYANGITGKFDGIAWHPYPWNYNRPMSQDTGSFWSHMSTAYATMQSKGDEAKKIWITETGYTTQYTNETTVQNYMSADVADFKTKDFLATYCWFSDEDNGELFGLSNANYPLVHRPRWSTYQSSISSQ